MKTSTFKRSMALFLALLLCFTTFIGSAVTPAFAAAAQSEVCVLSFPRDGDTNYSANWGHPDLNFTGGWHDKSTRFLSVHRKDAGSYDSAKPTERDHIVCDGNGFAQTKDLPYGVYTVHQTVGWDGRELIPDFDVYVAENGKTYRYLMQKLDELLYRERGIHITTLRHPMGFEYLMFKEPKVKPSSIENRQRLGVPLYGNGWPGPRVRWCTGQLKTHLIKRSRPDRGDAR